jgi:hypothetical protein
MESSPTPALDLSDVFAYVDARRDELIQRLIAYLRMPSISAWGMGMGEVAEYVAGALRELGLVTEVMPTARWPMVLGQYTGAGVGRADRAALRPL